MNPGDDELPRILLVEDDPVSACFLRDAASALPARVQAAASLAEALSEPALHLYDLYLIDANLPDGRGEALLHALRERGITTTALGHTAGRDDAVRERLLAAGFAEVLHKPLGITDLHRALRRHLGAEPTCGKPPAWDDDAARIAVGGQEGHVAVLRGLFLQELPGQRSRIEAAVHAADETTVRNELHRLAASCGFVGAARLAVAVRELQAKLLDEATLQRFGFAVDDLLGSA